MSSKLPPLARQSKACGIVRCGVCVYIYTQACMDVHFVDMHVSVLHAKA